MVVPIMKNKSYIVALAFLVLLSAGCDWRGVRGNGTIKTEQRPVGPFTRIEAGGFYDIQWQPGSPSFSLTTDENLLSHIETRMNGSVLKIETHGQIAPTHGVTVVITSPSLTGAELSGALKLKATQLSGDRFALDTSGATKVALAYATSLRKDVTVVTSRDTSRAARMLKRAMMAGLNAGGVNVLDLAGRANRLIASLTGASKLNAETLQTQDVEISVTGAGKADVNATNSLRAAITGAGRVSYGGNPKSIEKKITGAGKISPRD